MLSFLLLTSFSNKVVGNVQLQALLKINLVNYLFLQPFPSSFYPPPQHSFPAPSPEQIILLPTEEDRPSDEELLFHFLSFIPPSNREALKMGEGKVWF